MFPSQYPTSLISQQLSDFGGLNAVVSTSISPHQPQVHEISQKKIKKKRSLPGNPDPEAEVIALSPKTLLATNRFVCEICDKGFQRDQNLQLHRRGHNLPWKLKQRKEGGGMTMMRKRAYVCPEASCVHHHPSRALGDLTGIKKHYCRKHGEKKWKCDKCDKIYAVHSDWKAHSKTCGTRDYRCDCGTLFSRKDSFITHRAFCDALAEETARIGSASRAATYPDLHHHFAASIVKTISDPSHLLSFAPKNSNHNPNVRIKPETTPSDHHSSSSLLFQDPTKEVTVPSPFPATTCLPHLSATALLQKAATVGPTTTQLINNMGSPEQLAAWQKKDRLTRDFLGLAAGGGVSVNVEINVGDILTSTSFAAGGLELRQQLQQQQHQGNYTFAAPEAWGN